MLWTGFSLKLSQYFGALSFSSTLTSPSVPAAEKQPHSMRLLPAHFTFGTVLKVKSQSQLYCQFCHMYRTYIQRIEIALLSYSLVHTDNTKHKQ